MRILELLWEGLLTFNGFFVSFANKIRDESYMYKKNRKNRKNIKKRRKKKEKTQGGKEGEKGFNNMFVY